AAEREARTLFNLGEHRFVLTAYGYHTSGPWGGPCLELEHVPHAQPLDQFLREHPALSFEHRLRIIEQLAEALDYCHTRRIYHRGLSPRAVLVHTDPTREDAAPEIRLYNFQLSFTETGTSQGTIHLSALASDDDAVYRAPELFENPVAASAASDLFSLGALAWHVLVGRPPGADVTERNQMLDNAGLLSVAAANDALATFGVGATGRDTLEEVFELATAYAIQRRGTNVMAWVELLHEAVTTPDPLPSGPQEIDALEARRGDVIDDRFEV